MIFTFHGKAGLPSALRSLIIQKKPNTRNMSSMSRVEYLAGYNPWDRKESDMTWHACQANSGPLLLLGQSEPDKWNCPLWPLFQAPAFLCVPRMGCPQFGECEFSVYTGSLPSLEESSEQLKDTVTFLLGGSFSLGEVWEDMGLPAYKTAVSYAIITGFCCPLVVTMMPAPKDKLGRLGQATWSMPGEQGQRHSHGDPELLGIRDLSKPDYREVVVCQPGRVPVFWPSQLTSLKAVGSSHQGCTVTTNLKGTATPTRHLTPEGIPEIHHISQDPLHYSMASAAAIQRISELEMIIAIDPGNKGKGHICLGELLQASLARSHARSVLLTTIFPMYFNYRPPDRLPGAVALAAFLQALEKGSSMVVKQRDLSVHKKLVDEATEQMSTPMLTYQSGSVGADQVFLCRDGNPKSPRFDHLVAIKHAERALLGDPIDDLFLGAHKIPGISSTGVNDKGNKLGMDKVKEAVKRHIRNGDILTCDMESDFAVITAKCSDGPQALPGKETGPFRPPGEQNWTRALPSVTKEEKLPGILVQHGVWSRFSSTLGTEVDRLLFHGTHAQMIQKLMGITLP
uniref:D-glutamate cyclase n=1 Tax=Bos mutus grunniens TaxID=30521 RepID=A0A8B9XKE4_BOSMU